MGLNQKMAYDFTPEKILVHSAKAVKTFACNAL